MYLTSDFGSYEGFEQNLSYSWSRGQADKLLALPLFIGGIIITNVSVGSDTSHSQ